MYQTDFSGELRKSGCLFMSLIAIAEEAAKRAFSREMVLELYSQLNDQAILGTEESGHETGAFVFNHVSVLNEASLMLGHRVRWNYVGRIYEPWEVKKGRKSFGSHERATHVILQIQTPNTGHFRRLDYDPWGGGTTMLFLKSTRYYRMED